MQNNFGKKLINILKINKRIFLVVAFLGLVFVINQALYANHKKTTEACASGKCLSTVAEKPQLTKDNGYYYVDDIFKDQPSGYYRVTFLEKSDSAMPVLMDLNTYTEKESQIAELNLVPSDKFQPQEVFFYLSDGFDSLLFQKKDPNSAGNIFIKAVGITKLNATSQAELVAMKKTLVGETNLEAVTASQTDSDYAFPWLKDSKTILGQVFQAKDSVISAVSLKIDINKNLNSGSRQYTLSLRKVNYDGESVSYDGAVIVDTAFSFSSIEKYRQADGTFLFPLFGMLEKNQYYLISLDNSKVDVSKQNYLELKGSKEDKYSAGIAVVKKGKEMYPIDGDLYFKIYGAQLLQEGGMKIFNGAKIEDLGKGSGRYSYATEGKFVDLFDLSGASAGTEFSESDKIIYAPAKDNASFSYAVNMLYPISKLNFSASQVKAGWKKVKVSYSFDQNDWVDLPFSAGSELATTAIEADNGESVDGSSSDTSEAQDSLAVADNTVPVVTEESVQVFDADIVPTKEARTVYFKITYDPSDTSKGKSFALKNLKITAELKLK
ncbi:MAG: hypothetical protein WC848_03690 [Parcubacteria group bacterium]|jgi:hypothetical protein